VLPALRQERRGMKRLECRPLLHAPSSFAGRLPPSHSSRAGSRDVRSLPPLWVRGGKSDLQARVPTRGEAEPTVGEAQRRAAAPPTPCDAGQEEIVGRRWVVTSPNGEIRSSYHIVHLTDTSIPSQAISIFSPTKHQGIALI
jgi:hypothetical protein